MILKCFDLSGICSVNHNSLFMHLLIGSVSYACEDTSHQCIDLYSENGRPMLKVREEDCVGCNLCSIVCPAEGAITMKELPHTQPPMTWNERQSLIAGFATNSSSTVR